MIQQGITEGAKLVTGGVGRPNGLSKGYYVKPTVFSDVRNDMTIAREEIFGPVLCMIPYKDDDDAVRMANDTPYGLAGFVSSGNIERARSVAKRIRAGNVHINGARAILPAALADTNNRATGASGAKLVWKNSWNSKQSSVTSQSGNETTSTCDRRVPKLQLRPAHDLPIPGGIMRYQNSGAVSPLTLLKPGSESRLIFMTHGIGGRMTDLAPLASHISTTAAIYGVSAPGADGTAGSFDRIEDLAQFYLDVIRKKQPHGPYFLIGYSLGGLAFFEMCRRLGEAREKVALLVMLESYPHAKSLGSGAQSPYGWASFKQRLG